MPDPRGSRRLLGGLAAVCAYAAASPVDAEVSAAIRLLADIQGGLQATLDQAETTASFLDVARFSRPHSGDPVLWAQFFFALAL